MKYICNHCSKEFDEPSTNKLITSLLIRNMFLVCPYCRSDSIELTEIGKLLIERKKKINKINGE